MMHTGNELVFADGTVVAIPETIQMEHYSPFFDREENEYVYNPRGLKEFPFTTALTPTLRKALNLPDVPAKKRLNEDGLNAGVPDVILRSDGHRIGKGTLHVLELEKNLNTGMATVSLLWQNSEKTFLDLIEGKTLKQLEMDGQRWIYNTFGMGGIDGGLQDIEDDIANAADFEYFSESPPGEEPYYVVRAKPWESIFRWHALNSTYDYHQVVSLWAQEITKDGDPYLCFPSMYMLKHEDSTSGSGSTPGRPLNGILNYWDAVNERFPTFREEVVNMGVCNVSNYVDLQNQIVPMYYLHQVLRHCFTEVGYTLSGELLDDERFQKLVVYNTHSCLEAEIWRCSHLFVEAANDLNLLYCERPHHFRPSDHLPDVAVVDFLRDIMLRFGVVFEFDSANRTVLMRGGRFDVAATELSKFHPEIKLVSTMETGFELKHRIPSEDTSYNGVDSYTPSAVGIQESVDDSIEAGLATGDRYLRNEYNDIREMTGEAPPEDVNIICCNVVPWYTGSSKKYELQFVPVSMATNRYPQDDDETLNAYFPCFGHSISYRPTTIYTSTSDTLGGAGIVEIVFDPHNPSEWVKGTELTKIMFYEGLLGTLDLATDYPFPFGNMGNYQTKNSSSVKLGDWHLGLVGTEGCVMVFWGSLQNIYDYNQKIVVQPEWSLYDLLRHHWHNSLLWRGVRVYVAVMRYELPLRNRPVLDCWKL